LNLSSRLFFDATKQGNRDTLRKKILEGIEMKGTKRRTLLEKNGKSDD
jgi:hypothetical protein